MLSETEGQATVLRAATSCGGDGSSSAGGSCSSSSSSCAQVRCRAGIRARGSYSLQMSANELLEALPGFFQQHNLLGCAFPGTGGLITGATT